MNKNPINSYLYFLEAVARDAEKRMKFIATNRVDSEAILSLDRRICVPGDRIEVIRWDCQHGPTTIKVTSSELKGGEHCIPFGWVMEMGAPSDLATYMPFAPKSWKEVIAEERAKQGGAQ
jgi:hypothetical protein